MLGEPGEKWGNINAALIKGLRGLPRGSSLAQLLAEKRGVRNVQALPDFTVERILQWTDIHRQKTGEWPNVNSGDVTSAPGEKWMNIHLALYVGGRGLPGGSSLAQLLAEERGVRNRGDLPSLTEEQILKWSEAHYQQTGNWPKSTSGDVLGEPGEKWGNINAALIQGLRGLPCGSSLAQLLAEKRGVRNVKALPDLTVQQILKWVDAHNQKTGEWPNATSGDVLGAPGEKWMNIHLALYAGGRGLPGGSSLAQLLAEERGVRNRGDLPSLTEEQILKWSEAHYQQTGNWPKSTSGDVLGEPGEKWVNINSALDRGHRGLPGKSSLAQLLQNKRGVKNHLALSDLTVEQILKWVTAHHHKTGDWPRVASGDVLDTPDEKWRNIDNALRYGLRGLPGGSSLAKLLAEKRKTL